LKAEGRQFLEAHGSSRRPPEELHRAAAENAEAIARIEAILAELKEEASRTALP
jgi:hypothetical protein